MLKKIFLRGGYRLHWDYPRGYIFTPLYTRCYFIYFHTSYYTEKQLKS